MALLPVADALEALLSGADLIGAENVPLDQAAGRVLAEPLVARRTQPPFDASAMDGYAVRSADTQALPATLRLTGVSAAGKRFEGGISAGEAVRIFTGAPVPPGADAVLIQENAKALGADAIEVLEPVAAGRNIRKAGLDFRIGQPLLERGRVFDAGALSLAAASNHPALSIVRKPLVAILATGDELLPPGSEPGPDQIIASNAYGVAAIARQAGADVLDLGIALDRKDAIAAAIDKARQAGAHVLVTLGGASVGDHDLVNAVLVAEGTTIGFWKIAMRPGKPLMFGRLGDCRVLGLPGNPVASLVCSHLFLKPLIARLSGVPHNPDYRGAVLETDMAANDLREDYVRGHAIMRDGRLAVTPFAVQDSSMLKTLADANALIIRKPFAPAARAGDPCRILMIR